MTGDDELERIIWRYVRDGIDLAGPSLRIEARQSLEAAAVLLACQTGVKLDARLPQEAVDGWDGPNRIGGLIAVDGAPFRFLHWNRTLHPKKDGTGFHDEAYRLIITP